MALPCKFVRNINFGAAVAHASVCTSPPIIVTLSFVPIHHNITATTGINIPHVSSQFQAQSRLTTRIITKYQASPTQYQALGNRHTSGFASTFSAVVESRQRPQYRRNFAQRQLQCYFSGNTKVTAMDSVKKPSSDGQQSILMTKEFWTSGEKVVLAPMTDASDLAFRLLCRSYGVKLCHTPMMYASHFVEHDRYRDDNFHTCAEDRPLVVQFCATNPKTFVEASLKVAEQCDAVELNVDWNQKKAAAGPYGALLQTDWDTVVDMVASATQVLTIPVSCKIRLFPTVEESVSRAKQLEVAGCKILVVHGRTRFQKGVNRGVSDWSQIAAIKRALDITVITNGSVIDAEDVDKCLAVTGCDAVMCGEALLSDPSLCKQQLHVRGDQMAKEYLDLCKIHPSNPATMRRHLAQFWCRSLRHHQQIRDQLAGAYTRHAFQIVTDDLTTLIDKASSDTHTAAAKDIDAHRHAASDEAHTHTASDNAHTHTATAIDAPLTQPRSPLLKYWLCQPNLPLLEQSQTPNRPSGSGVEPGSSINYKRYPEDTDQRLRALSHKQRIEVEVPQEDFTMDFVPLLSKTAEKKLSSISRAKRRSKEAEKEHKKRRKLLHQDKLMGKRRIISPDARVDTIVIAKDAVGLVIGARGLTVRTIEEDSGCQILLEPDSDPDAKEKRLSLTGTKSEIETARDLINRVLAGEKLKINSGARDRGAERRRLRDAMLPEADVQTLKVAIDMGMGDAMSNKEHQKLANQIRRLYGSNLESEAPAHVYLTGLEEDSAIHRSLRRHCAGFDNYVLTKSGKRHSELFDNDKIIYMTPDSPNALLTLDSDKIYVVGGLVDEHIKKNFTLHNAKNIGIQTARLPIVEKSTKVKDGQASQVLAANQVFEILLRYWNTKDWAAALRPALPTRKGFVVEESDDDDSNNTNNNNNNNTNVNSNNSVGDNKHNNHDNSTTPTLTATTTPTPTTATTITTPATNNHINHNSNHNDNNNNNNNHNTLASNNTTTTSAQSK